MRYEKKQDIVVPLSLWRHLWLKKNHHAVHMQRSASSRGGGFDKIIFT